MVFLYEIHDLIHVIMAQLIAARLGHHAHQRLGPAGPYEDAPFIAELRFHLSDLRLQPLICHRTVLVLDFDVDEQLRIDEQIRAQFFQRLALIAHDLQQLERRQQPIAGHCMLQEDDVAALLSADAVALALHALKDIFVTDRGLHMIDRVLCASRRFFFI